MNPTKDPMIKLCACGVTHPLSELSKHWAVCPENPRVNPSTHIVFAEDKVVETKTKS